MRSPARALALVLLVSLSSACASGSGPESEPAPEMAGPGFGDAIGRVEVGPADTLNDPERVAAFKRYQVPDKLAAAVDGDLRRAGRLDPGAGTTLRLLVDDFRLRSGSSAFWAGVMAGADRISVRVFVERDGRELRSYTTNTSTALGGIAYASSTKRLDRLIKTLAERVVAGL
jgi:hypothetical protein